MPAVQPSRSLQLRAASGLIALLAAADSAATTGALPRQVADALPTAVAPVAALRPDAPVVLIGPVVEAPPPPPERLPPPVAPAVSLVPGAFFHPPAREP